MDIFVCSKCGVNLIEYGITEVLVGAIVETDISFYPKRGGLANEVEYHTPDTHDFNDQWVICGSCGAELHDRTAAKMIDAFEKS